MAEQCKAWVCDLSLAGIIGSNAVGVTDVCCLVRVMCCRVEVCEEPIPRSEKIYRVCVYVCVCVCVCVCVSLSVFKCNSKPLHLQRGRKRSEYIKKI